MKRLFTVLLFAASACGQEGTITHVIYLIKENRSFDHYFGAYPGVRSYCQGGHSAVNTVCIAPDDAANQCTSGDTCPQPVAGLSRHNGDSYSLLLENGTTAYEDVTHTHVALLNYTDAGLMDKFTITGCPNSAGTPTTQPCAYAYFDRSQIPIYYSYADTYGLADNFFSVMTPSAPGHMYIFAASSNGVSDNPVYLTVGGKTCLAGTNAGVNCTANAQCPGSSCSNAWQSNWTCEATHTGTGQPFTYIGQETSTTVTTGLYCSNATNNVTNGVACTHDSECTAAGFPQCRGTGYYGGICAANAATACSCSCRPGEQCMRAQLGTCSGGSNAGENCATNGSQCPGGTCVASSSCSDTTACGSANPACKLTDSIGSQPGAPCPNLATIADRLDATRVRWSYYTSDPDRNPAAMFANIRYGHCNNSDSTVCTSTSQCSGGGTCVQDFASKMFGENQFALDADAALGWCSGNHALACSLDSYCTGQKAGTCIDNSSNALPTVSFIQPGPGQNPLANEHPSNTPGVGENWTDSAVVQHVLKNPYLYNHSVIFITWDDSGGFWDHVNPPMQDGLALGMRVPLLCVGPYCVHSVNHLQMEFASVLKCVESLFGLSPINSRDEAANDACFGTGTKRNPGTGADAGMLNLAQPPIPAPASLSARGN